MPRICIQCWKYKQAYQELENKDLTWSFCKERCGGWMNSTTPGICYHESGLGDGMCTNPAIIEEEIFKLIDEWFMIKKERLGKHIAESIRCEELEKIQKFEEEFMEYIKNNPIRIKDNLDESKTDI